MAEKHEPFLDVTVDSGKYRFYQETARSPLQVFRHGEPWVYNLSLNVVAGKALTAALFDLEHAKKTLNTIKTALLDG